ncbi:MAG: YjzC family protein [Chloroflexota bacterium]|nr:YjzC family protein [Chloroflexota bacterium]MDQ5866823.1 YjzC family protein [Chloroflexota bacterium]
MSDDLQKPGETPNRPGRYREVGPRGGEVPDPNTATMDPRDRHLPPTQEPGRRWKPVRSPKR